MPSDAIKDGTKRLSAGEKIANSDKAAREIIAKEKAQRESKSARLRQARFAQEAERATSSAAKPLKPRNRSSKP
ncbi:MULTISPECIES: hypothetical protein [Rhizobium]|uniref:hypothetical protein n=1 Tax=Rhizobium TaxID=379 RepID=UPI00195D15A8|nr:MULTISPECIES: hypothetical protein [Rhizobium]MBM7046519.1 hypothetical protein [Rhizobium lusitanum]